MKSLKKAACILIVLVFLLSMSACGGNTSSTVQGTSTEIVTAANTTSAVSADPEVDALISKMNISIPSSDQFKDKLPVKWLYFGNYSAYKKGTIVERVFNKLFNVELSVLPVDATSAEKINVVFAAGNIPDVFVFENPNSYYKSGIIREIPMDMVEKYMPWTFNNINSNDGEYAWYTAKDNETKTKLLGIPCYAAMGACRIGFGLRQDWLDNLGITTLPATIDELHDVLLRFRNDDPDKNGKKDTYALGGIGKAQWKRQFAPVFGAFGTMPDIWMETNGKIVPSFADESYKSALKVLAQWYKEGIIDPEFITEETTTYWAKCVDGKIGVFEAGPDYYAPGVDLPPALIAKKDPKAKYTVIPAIKGPDGKSGSFAWGGYFGWDMMFGKNTSDEIMIRAMQIADTMVSNYDLFKLAAKGVDGVTYEMKGTKPITKEGIVATDYGFDQYLFPFRLLQTETIYYDETCTKMGEESMKDNWITNAIDFSKQDEQLRKNEKYRPDDIIKAAEEFYYNAITGKLDIDAKWDAYVKNLMDLGYSLSIPEAQNAPKFNRK